MNEAGSSTAPWAATGRTPTRRRGRIERAATVGVAALGACLLWWLVWAERRAHEGTFDLRGFVIVATALLLGESLRRVWITAGADVVTPIWALGYALMLFGSPALAVAVALLASIIHTRLRRTNGRWTIRRASAITASLSAGGLVLLTLGAGRSITEFETLPWRTAAAVTAAGVTIVFVNASLLAIGTALSHGTSIGQALQRRLALRVTAEGALASLAPIWVVAVDFSPVLTPLLVISTVLVFRSSRQALDTVFEAEHDPLTGLVNRRAFLTRLERALQDRRAAEPAVLLMDLDRFKEINDRLGHHVGDALLVAFARRLEQALPSSAAAARLGGDEFAVLVGGTAGLAERLAGVERLHAELTQPLTVEGFPVTVGVSIGVAAAPADGTTPSELLRAADIAMYKAKRCGTSVERHEPTDGAPQRGRILLLADLSRALPGHQLHINFQPQLHIATGTVDTVEALIRWQHPQLGAIEPGAFIGLAEQTDLIGPITEFVLRAAVKGVATSGHDDVKLAVNVSARSLEDPSFADLVFAIASEAGLAPQRLELEVTERAIATDLERTARTIARLRSRGVRIAIDDFGAGYSSYQTLRAVEADRVKIDRDFVRGITVDRRDRLIVGSLINLAHSLELDVVAEGVEDPATWNLLGDLGCDVAQGFAIAIPMAFPDLRGWLTSWSEVLVEELASIGR